MHRETTIGSLSGSVIGSVGGITAIVDTILAPFTLGASLIITGVGVGVSVAGGVTGAVSDITDMASTSTDWLTIDRIVKEIQVKMEPTVENLDNINLSFKSLPTFQKDAAFKAGRCSTNFAPELVRIIWFATIGKGAAQASRTVRVAGALSGVLSGLFLAMEIFFIAKESMEIHQINQH